jgi:hypothetical protein
VIATAQETTGMQYQTCSHVAESILNYGPYRQEYLEGRSVHVHVTDGKNLTIIETGEESLARHLDGEIEDILDENDRVNCDILRSMEADVEVVTLTFATGKTIQFRLRSCIDPTCWEVLREFWL